MKSGIIGHNLKVIATSSKLSIAHAGHSSGLSDMEKSLFGPMCNRNFTNLLVICSSHWRVISAQMRVWLALVTASLLYLWLLASRLLVVMRSSGFAGPSAGHEVLNLVQLLWIFYNHFLTKETLYVPRKLPIILAPMTIWIRALYRFRYGSSCFTVVTSVLI